MPQASLLNIEWDRVAPLLGAETAEQLLLPCPWCQHAQLTLYADDLTRSRWGYCRHCARHGDILQLLEAAWNVSPDQVLLRLAAEKRLTGTFPSSDTIAAYHADVRARTQLAAFWQEAQQEFIGSGASEIAEFRHKLDLPSNYTNSLWQADSPIGAVSVERFRSLFLKELGHSRCLNFNSPGWQHLLVIPLYSLPGKLSGLYVAGRQLSAKQGDCQLRWLDARRPYGITGWKHLLEPPRAPYHDNTVVFDNPLLAIKLQLQWQHTSAHALPLIAMAGWSNADTRPLWQSVPPRRYYFWSGTDIPGCLREARRARGHVVTLNLLCRPSQNDRDQQQAWLAKLVKGGKPWLNTLDQMVRDWPADLVAQILVNLDIPPDERARTLAQLSPTAQARLPQLLEPAQLQGLTLRGNKIGIDAEGWFLQKTKERLCNGVVTLTHAITTTSGRNYYRGHVRYNGQTRTFTSNMLDIQKRGLLEVVREFLASQGLGGFTYARAWNKDAERLALLTSPPKTVMGIDRVGWHREQQRFYFPNFTLTACGARETDTDALVTELPAAALPVPSPIPAEQLALMASATPELAIFWLTLAATVAQVVAPYYRRPAPGFCLSGAGAQTWGSELLATCCRKLAFRAYTGVRGHVNLESDLNQHDWPSLCTPTQSFHELDVQQSWITGVGTRNCFLQPDQMTALAAATHGWGCLSHDPYIQNLSELRDAFPRVWSAYFQDLASRSFNWYVARESTDLVPQIVYDIDGWLHAELGTSFRPEIVLGHYSAGDCPASAWAKLVGLLLAGHRLTYHEYGEPEDFALPLVFRRPGAVFIPQHGFNTQLTRLGIPVVDNVAVARDLHEQGLLVDGTDTSGATGWLVEQGWWEKHCEGRSAAPATTPWSFRIVG